MLVPFIYPQGERKQTVKAWGTGCFGFGSTIMETFQELRHLSWAEEHLRQANKRIARQEAVVAAFEARGMIKESEKARALLATMLQSLKLMVQHHNEIEQELSRARRK